MLLKLFKNFKYFKVNATCGLVFICNSSDCLKHLFKASFIHACELMGCLRVFSPTGQQSTAILLDSTFYLPHRYGTMSSNAFSKYTTSEFAVFFNTYSFVLSAKQGNCEYQYLNSLIWLIQGIETRSMDCKADAVTAVPLRWFSKAMSRDLCFGELNKFILLCGDFILGLS